MTVQKGKGNDAREILSQRKKVLQALEMSKTRIELLDELFTKLCETKQKNLQVQFESLVQRRNVAKILLTMTMDFNVMKSLDIQDVQPSVESQGDWLGDKEIEDLQQSLNTSCLDEDKKALVLTEMSSYEALMEHIDRKLGEIEVELITALKASNLLLDGDEKPNNSRWQQAVELLESIHRIRQRYTSLSSKAPNLLLR